MPYVTEICLIAAVVIAGQAFGEPVLHRLEAVWSAVSARALTRRRRR